MTPLREHITRTIVIAGVVVGGLAFLAAAPPDAPPSVVDAVTGALVVLVPALLDALRHWRRIVELSPRRSDDDGA